MPDWFKDKLIEFLPQLYAINDGYGDLKAFLKLPEKTLGELKEAIDNFPQIFDVDSCDERFLQFLANIVGMETDGRMAPDYLRRRIREAVEIYRRKSTIPAIEKSLKKLGWEGELEETFRSACRLNSRSKVSRAKLPGEVFSLGVYRINTTNQPDGVREALKFHHPAGTRAYFFQWLTTLFEIGSDLQFENANAIRRTALAFMDDKFVLGRTSLGACHHLTNKQQTWELMQLTSVVEMEPEIDRAAIKISRFLGRQDRMRLNLKVLNSRRLPNTELSEIRLSLCTPLYTGHDYKKDVLESGFYLTNRLNKKPLPTAEAALRYCFRQKDFYTEAQGGFETAVNIYRATRWPAA